MSRLHVPLDSTPTSRRAFRPAPTRVPWAIFVLPAPVRQCLCLRSGTVDAHCCLLGLSSFRCQLCHFLAPRATLVKPSSSPRLRVLGCVGTGQPCFPNRLLSLFPFTDAHPLFLSPFFDPAWAGIVKWPPWTLRNVRPAATATPSGSPTPLAPGRAPPASSVRNPRKQRVLNVVALSFTARKGRAPRRKPWRGSTP